MELLKGILGLCFLFGAFGEETTTTDITDETTLVTVIISTTTGKENDSTTTDIDTDGDIILTADPLTLEQSTTTDVTNEISTITEISTETEKPITTTINPTKPEHSICSYKPCKNDGVCIEDQEDKLKYTCNCKKGFAGLHCGTRDFCAVDSNGKLCRNGMCLYSENGTTRACSCFMGMYWDDVEKECREPDPPCFPNPCQNGKPCKELDDGFECVCGEHFEGKICDIRNRCGSCNDGDCVLEDKAALKFCKCHPGFYWNDQNEACQKIVPPCQPNPCHNSGTCEELPTGGFNCSCASDYSGSGCKILDLCRTDQDCGNGICSLKASENTRVCRCSEGYYLEETTQACQENQLPCRPNPCSNDGVCIPLDERDFNCTCSEGFMGKLCEKKNFCVMDGGHKYCGPAQCLNDHSLHTYYCACPDGHYFDYADHACKVLDLCPLMECESNEVCINNNCTCKGDFKWNAEKKMCEPHLCDKLPCPVPDMVCREGTASEDYSCSCAEGYAFDGTHCNSASCIFPKLNSCEQTCAMNNEDYTCGCHNKDFELKDNRTCVYHGNATCNNKTCDGVACVREGEEEICLCPPGYSEVNGKCVDDCTSGNLSPGFCPDGCEPLKKNGFRCRCEGKYALSEDGVTCTVRKVCEREEIGWSTCTWRKAKCVEDWSRPEGYRCECGLGQMQTPQGVCKGLCDVEENQKECSAMKATCDVNEYGHRVCRCPPLFQSNAQGTVCNKPAEYSYLVTLPLDLSAYQKDSSQSGRGRRSPTEESNIDYQRIKSDISASMAALFPGFINANLLTCRLAVDYILCKSELQFQQVTEKELDRLKMTDICFEREDSSGNTCVLARSLVLNKNKMAAVVKTKPGDPCEVDVKEDLCGSETNCASSLTTKSFNCSCKAGFDVRNKVYPFGDTKSIIEICKDINECKESQACHDSMDCTNTIGSYYCTCKSGYRRSADPKENKCIEICDPSPCDHGQCTEKGDHDYECSCDAGYTGAMCNLQDANFKRARTNTIIVGAVLGGILLLTLVLAFAFVSRLKKKKHLEDPNQMLYNAAEMTERRTPIEGTINNAYQ